MPMALRFPDQTTRPIWWTDFLSERIVGRVNAGAVFLLGADFSRRELTPGRLYLAVNDNSHWQNNIGAFRVSLQATDAYDVGSAE